MIVNTFCHNASSSISTAFATVAEVLCESNQHRYNHQRANESYNLMIIIIIKVERHFAFSTAHRDLSFIPVILP